MRPIIQHVRETGSTNSDLIARLAAGEVLAEGTWLVADRQHAGRGRQGRSWIGGAGNFMGSTLVHIERAGPPPASLSFVAALAVYEALVTRIAQPQGLQLKWPNDVLLDGEKLSGILLEREGDIAVVGIGVNLAGAPLLPGRRVRSLADHGPAPDRDGFAEALAASFATELARWRRGGTGPLFTRWLAAAHPHDARLAVHDGAGAVQRGRFDGLEADGALRLRLDDGEIRIVHAGDVELENARCS